MGSSGLCAVGSSETAAGMDTHWDWGWAHTGTGAGHTLGWGSAQRGPAVGQIPVPWDQL